MHITMRTQGFDRTAAIDAFVEREIRLTMARFSDEIFSVDVFMKDINGPKGGIDKQVLVRVKLRGGKQIALVTMREDLYAAVRVSAKRAKRAIRRNIRRNRQVARQRLGHLLANRQANEVAGA